MAQKLISYQHTGSRKTCGQTAWAGLEPLLEMI